MPANKNITATELSKGWLKYVVENDITNPTENDIVAYLTDAGYEDLAVKKIVSDVQFTKKGNKSKKAPSNKEEVHDEFQDEPEVDDSVLDIDDLNQRQIDTLNKIKDVVRMKMTKKQRIDLRRYLENE